MNRLPDNSEQQYGCKYKAPNPAVLGYRTWEQVKEAAEKFPHLRPCPKHNWHWTYKTYCEKCKNRKEKTTDSDNQQGDTQ